MFALVFFLVVGVALLVDLLVLIRENTLVIGLFDILFGRPCFLVVTCLVTVVFAGLSDVKGLQIGMLLVCAISLTFFMLWSMTGLYRSSHFFSC